MTASWTLWYPLTPSTIRRAPESPGVYEIALDGRRHRYPRGLSSTIYYGKADASIASRLHSHHGGRGNVLVAQYLAASSTASSAGSAPGQPGTSGVVGGDRRET
ncbi:MAG: hypothetical protein R3B09_26380 [Nannocystaceae bacterium]